MNLRRPKSKTLPLHALPPRPLAVKTRRAVQTRGGGIPKNAQEGHAHWGFSDRVVCPRLRLGEAIPEGGGNTRLWFYSLLLSRLGVATPDGGDNTLLVIYSWPLSWRT